MTRLVMFREPAGKPAERCVVLRLPPAQIAHMPNKDDIVQFVKSRRYRPMTLEELARQFSVAPADIEEFKQKLNENKNRLTLKQKSICRLPKQLE